MEKVLRSLIHEKFSEEVRVQLEMVSRRRDIINEEKQEEIIKILRENHVEGIGQLGPGTNRYAIKIDGFVVKIATDHDGKIDNMKEFKMAKRLFPYVAKTYEVSENGTLLVAEYIQPFDSYTEMCRYADRIRDILRKLSAVYLIGDVGITSKNYVNWGIRVGTDDPVCLDFAYVYDVSSSLFVCRHCKVGMLVPDKDFTTLFCNRKGCGKETSFIDIRTMIGNDIHRHEIGNLADEGYVMDSSNRLTVLTENRSNYLLRKKKGIKKKKVKVKDSYEAYYSDDDESESNNNFINNKEEVIMSSLENAKVVASYLSKDDTQKSKGLIVKAKATITEKEDTKEEVIDVESKVVSDNEPYSEEEFEERISEALGVAFSGKMSDILDENEESADEVDEEEIDEPEDEEDDAEEVETETIEAEVVEAKVEEPKEEPKTVVAKATVVTTESKPQPAKQQNHQKRNRIQKQDNKFTPNFVESIPRALSRFSNRIGEHLHVQDAFGMVSGHIKDKKMYPENFYKSVQNAVFRSLALFFNLKEENIPNDSGKGFHKQFNPPEVIEGEPFERSLLYIKRIWNEREFNQLEDSEEMKRKYAEVYDDGITGLQHEWIPLLKDRLQKKIQIDHVGAQIICDLVEVMWCEVTPLSEEEMMTILETEGPLNVEKINKDPTDQEEEQHELEGSYPTEDMTDDSEAEAKLDNIIHEIEGDEEDQSDFEEYEPEYLSVEIHNDDDTDIVKVITEEFFGQVSIPIYTNLQEIDPNKYIPSPVDDRNGIWDWIIHTSPDMMFYTDDPDQYLGFNDEPLDLNQIKVVVLGQDETGKYIMGIYYVQGIFYVDDEDIYHPITDPETLSKINNVIRENIADTAISHRLRNLSMTSIIVSEEYIQKAIEAGGLVIGSTPETIGAEEDPGDDDGEDELIETEEITGELPEDDSEDVGTLSDNSAYTDISDAEAAAIAAMMSGSSIESSESSQGTKTYKPFRRTVSED